MNVNRLCVVGWLVTFMAALGANPPEVTAQAAAGGDLHTSVVTSAGTLWTWGGNGSGQIGDGGTTTRKRPFAPSGMTGVVGVAAGDAHTLVVKSNGSVWAFGSNVNGRLGDGTTTQRKTPVQVTALSNVIVVAAGASHSLALTSSGVVYAWGYNASGQVGNGGTSDQTSPVVVSGLTTIVAIAANGDHSLALASDGSVWAWGENGNGQLGDGSNTDRTTPVAVSSLTGVIAIAAGGTHSLALTGDGSVFAWGYNGFGQVGVTSPADQRSPVAVAGVGAATAIAAGLHHSIAIRQDGSAWAWGWNGYGQLGDGGNANPSSSSPVSVLSVSNASKIAAGGRHTVIITTDGTVWSAGDNQLYQVGDGTNVKRLTPVKVSEAGFAWKVGTPTFAPSTGTYQAVTNVTISSATTGTTIRYTTNGADPTESDAAVPVNGIVTVSQATTLKAKAWKSGIPESNVDSATYTLKIPMPNVTPGGTTYNTPQTVTVTTSISGATLHYTLNNQEPTEADPVVASGGTLTVAESLTLKVKAWKSGWTASDTKIATYTMKVGIPTVSPAPGSYTTPQTVTISTVTPGTSLRYTTTGREPNTTDPIVASGGTITIDGTMTLRVKGWRSGWSDSDTKVATYLLNLGTAASPTMTPAGGIYAATQTLTITTTTAGATIRYTLDGTDPGLTSRVYTNPLAIEADTTVKAKAFKPDWTASSIATASYTIDTGAVATPTFSLASGSHPSKRLVTVTSATPGATIRFTTNGTTPTVNDPIVTSGGAILIDQAVRLNAKAWKAGMTESGVRTADYAITGGIAAGAFHTMALKADGTVVSWGRNFCGELGNNNKIQQPSPVSVSGLTDVIAIAAGLCHSLALKQDGTVVAWGSNGSGRLGDGTTTERLTPVPVSGLTNVIAIAAGDSHSLALKADGTLWAWGANGLGQLGDGGTTPHFVPFQVPGLTGIAAIAAGADHSLALRTDGAPSGSVWAWGSNSDGQLGDGSTSHRYSPVRTASSAIAIDAGDDFSLAVTSDHALSSWGDNVGFMLGDGTQTDRWMPGTVLDLDAVTGAAGGRSHAVALTADGVAWVWGNLGSSGTFGLDESVSLPLRVIAAGFDNVAVAAGADHSVALARDGRLRTWGSNTYGQLGIGNTSSSPIAVEVPGLSLTTSTWFTGDADGDHLATWRELELGTDPVNADTNGDGVLDEAAEKIGLSSTSTDTDADGVANATERQAGTDPLNPDTDGDGAADASDAFPLDPTRSQAPAPNPGDTTPPVITLQYPASAVPIPPPQ